MKNSAPELYNCIMEDINKFIYEGDKLIKSARERNDSRDERQGLIYRGVGIELLEIIDTPDSKNIDAVYIRKPMFGGFGVHYKTGRLLIVSIADGFSMDVV